MKTFLAIKFALLPFAAFWVLLRYAEPSNAITVGFVLSIAGGIWRYFRREVVSLEIGSLIIFVGLGLSHFLFADFVNTNAAVLSFLGLGLVCLVTVATRKPWTADYSRNTFSQAIESPVFKTTNMILSALWGEP